MYEVDSSAKWQAAMITKLKIRLQKKNPTESVY
jgi:hypothetical protein